MRRVNHSRAMRLPRPRSRCRIRQAAFSRQRIPVSAGLRWLTAHLSVHIARKRNVAHAELRGIGVIDGNHGGPAVEPGMDPLTEGDKGNATAPPSLRLFARRVHTVRLCYGAKNCE